MVLISNYEQNVTDIHKCEIFHKLDIELVKHSLYTKSVRELCKRKEGDSHGN
jgi:hypothetical protein